MRLFVGLGNPGQKHQLDRHNIGFMALDAVVQRHGFSGWKKKFEGLVTEGTLGGMRVIFLKPQTFMNVSGLSVLSAAAFYKLPPEHIFAFHDELDLAPGKVRVKMGGGAAGHNGLRSIDEHLGPHYWRVRLGIGHPGNRDLVSSYVLGKFAAEDEKWLSPLLGAVAEHAAILTEAGREDLFMTRVAQDVLPAAPEEEARKQ